MIRLDNLFYIEVDSNNYTLVREEEKTIERKGEPKKVVSAQRWHYGNIKQCLIKYLNESLKPAEEVEQLLKKLERLESVINKIN